MHYKGNMKKSDYFISTPAKRRTNYITVLEVAKKYNKNPRGVRANIMRGAIKAKKREFCRDWLVSAISADNFYSTRQKNL